MNKGSVGTEFREATKALGFADLHPVSALTLGERVFPIGFQALGQRVPLVFAAFTQALEKADPRFGDGLRRRSAFLLAQEFLNAASTSDTTTNLPLRDFCHVLLNSSEFLYVE